ncbi:hypothetical protein BGX23_004992 [Mortierella sp. AD031]|nr:hypothetical protein BGX23_004992 [Mortierella sp. AD031]
MTMTPFKILTKNKTASATPSVTISPVQSRRSSVQEPRPDDYCTMTIEQALEQALLGRPALSSLKTTPSSKTYGRLL